MRHVLLLAAFLALGATDASAQGRGEDRGDGWWSPVSGEVIGSPDRMERLCRLRPDLAACRVVRGGERDRDERVGNTRAGRDERGPDTRADRDRRGREGHGPPFCRNGEGHPVFGMEWCRDKGFTGWVDGSLGDIILSPERSRRQGVLDRGGLIDILGDIVLGRLTGTARADIDGRFADGGRVLQIRSGATPLAELFDADGDGRVDRVLLNPRGPQ